MPGEADHIYEFDSFRLDTLERVLMHRDEFLPLPPKVIDTLVVLVEHAGHIVEKDYLMNHVWPGVYVEENNLNKTISALRKALSEDRDSSRFIETVPKRGYRFVAPVHVSNHGVDVSFRRRSTSRVIIEEEIDLPDEIHSLAILPFTMFGADDSDDYLGFGIADSLIRRLCGHGQMLIRPTSSVLKFLRSDLDVMDVGRSLRVDAVLAGTVRQHDHETRVSTQLVNVNDESIIWADQFDANISHLFRLEDNIADQLVRELKPALSFDEPTLVGYGNTENIEAYHHYLKGRFFLHKWSAEDVDRSIYFFTSATELDNRYALAYAGLADAHARRAFGQSTLHPIDEFKLAATAVRRALELNDGIAEAHIALGTISLHHQWDWNLAETEFKRALELAPKSAAAHHRYSEYLMAMGQWDHALAELDVALLIDPLSLAIGMHTGLALYGARRYPEAIKAYLETLELEPNFAGAHALLGWVYEEMGMFDEAISELHEASRLDPTPSWRFANLAHAYALEGNRAEALRLTTELIKLRTQRYVSSGSIAEIFAVLGEADRAFAWLDEAYRERDSSLAYLPVSRRMGSLPNDPRFKELLTRLGRGV